MEVINARQLHEKLLKQPATLLIDVLPAAEHHRAHIPGSTNAPLEDEAFVERVGRIVSDRAHPVVVYCAGRACGASSAAALALERAGFQNVFDFEGGMEEWRNAGYALLPA